MKKYIIPAVAVAGIAFILYLVWRKKDLEKRGGEKAETPPPPPPATGGGAPTGGGGGAPTGGGGATTAPDKFKILVKNINSPVEVRMLQKGLNNLGKNLLVDGIFGANTESALFQLTGNKGTTLQAFELFAKSRDTKYYLNPESLYY